MSDEKPPQAYIDWMKANYQKDLDCEAYWQYDSEVWRAARAAAFIEAAQIAETTSHVCDHPAVCDIADAIREKARQK